MSIKTRLKRIEAAIDPSSVCVCYPKVRYEVYLQDLGEDAVSNDPVLSGEPVPDVCPDCRKRNAKKSITVQLVDGTTKDRFPDEWNKHRNK